MKPTLEEVKNVAGITLSNCGVCGCDYNASLKQLQAFSQHWMKVQRESDHKAYLKILSIALRDMETIRNNTGE